MRVHTGQVQEPVNPGSFSIVYLQQECVPVAFDQCPSIFLFVRMTEDSLFARLTSTADTENGIIFVREIEGARGMWATLCMIGGWGCAPKQ